MIVDSLLKLRGHGSSGYLGALGDAGHNCGNYRGL